ncbi:MAG: tetratricopeptide repeat protein [Nitrospinae bacterium]|nr:tetratricopeptide repeat protein [Nitrospinota bacterium]
MSLIADSLKKAVKEKTAPKWEADRKINPVGKSEPLKRSGLATVFRVLLLIVLPAAILAYLISIGAFAFQETPITQKPDVPVSIPREEAKDPPRQKVGPGGSAKKFQQQPENVARREQTRPPRRSGRTIEVSPAEPTEKSSIEEETVQDGKAVVPNAAATIRAPEEPRSSKKEETVFKKVMTPYPPKKKAGKPEEVGIDVQNEKAAFLPLPDLKPASPVTPKIPPAVAEKKNLVVPPVEPTEKPVAAAAPVLEKQAVVPEEVPALKSEAVEILDNEIAVKPEAPSKPSEKLVLEKAQVSPKVSNETKENPEKLTIEIQKKNSGVASLPSSPVKPEISRIDPAGRENVFNNSDYYFNRGIFFQQAKDWQKALANYSKSEELDPNNPDTYNNKGVIFKEMGKFDQALDEFLRAVYLDAGYAKAYNNIGVVYFMKKNYQEAIRHYLKAIDLNPTNLEAFNNLAIIYKKQKELDRARGILNRALSLDPDHPGTNYNLAVLYEESSEIKPALHFYRRFIELGSLSYPSLVIQVKEHLETMKLQ